MNKQRNTTNMLPSIIVRLPSITERGTPAHHARIAFGHYLEAAEHQNHAARQHAKMHS